MLTALFLPASKCQAQSFRFLLRAEPDAIPANGISSTSVLVQARNLPVSGISAQPVVRFATTSGTIESQARLVNGVARVLLRSANLPGTAIVTAFIGSSREQVSVEFTEGTPTISRSWEIKGSPVACGNAWNIISAAGPCSLDIGGLHIESDVRLDIDISNRWLWAQGNAGRVIIRQGDGQKAHELRGDRLFYDLRRRRGIMRRGDTSNGPALQEFAGSQFLPVAANETEISPPPAVSPATIQPVAAESAALTPSSPSKIEIQSVTHDARMRPASIRFVDSAVVPAELRSPSALSLSPDQAPRVAALPQSLAPNSKTPAGEDADPGLTAPPSESPEYRALPSNKATFDEPAPPQTDYKRGYWVVSRWARVFPDDKLQFGSATVFRNGDKLFFMRLYVAPLNGDFNPATSMVGVNSSAGLSLRVPYFYQASPRGTGAVYLVHAPSRGFVAEKPGFSLAVDHEYYLSKRAQGRLTVDEIGHGGWNLDWSHQLELSPSLRASLYLNMPEHRDAYLSGTISKSFRNVDIGLETFYARPSSTPGTMQGNFYARLRPKEIGVSGWTYTVAANLSGLRNHYAQTTGSGGGIGLPGHTRPGQTPSSTLVSRSILGQTVSAVLVAPTYKLWKGGRLQASFSGTAFNYSDGNRGVSPGVTLGLNQNIGSSGSLSINYQYDRGLINQVGGTVVGRSTNNLVASMSMNLGPRIGSYFELSRGLSDGSTYGYSTIDYRFAPKWRTGLFSDYSRFDGAGFLNYGFSLGRQIGPRELSLNWDRSRGRFYFEFGNFLN